MDINRLAMGAPGDSRGDGGGEQRLVGGGTLLKGLKRTIENIVFSSSVEPAARDAAAQHKQLARSGRLRRFIRIGMLLTVIAVPPRWRPLLAGIALTVLGVATREGAGGVLIIPGLLVPGCHHRRDT